MAELGDRRMDLSALVDGARDAIIGYGLDGTIICWNPAAAGLLGYTAEEALGRTADLLMPGRRLGGLPDAIRRIGRGERILPYQDEFAARDGRRIGVWVTLSPVRKGSGQLAGVSQIARPLGARSPAVFSRAGQASDEAGPDLLRLARLGSMGQMAMAMVHELSEPVMAIANYLTAARRLLQAGETGVSPRLAVSLDRACDQALRAARILHRLRAAASGDGDFPGHAAISSSLAAASELLLPAACLVGVAIDVRGVADAALAIDPAALREVLFHLMLNAIEAMTDAPDRTLRVSTVLNRDHAEIILADSGPGMAPEIASGLFLPFTTTKPGSMGLGLVVCRAVVAAHGGALWYDSAARLGATVHLRLPLAPRAGGG